MMGSENRVADGLAGQTPFVVHYSKVGIEIAKIVFRGQKMAPPYVFPRLPPAPPDLLTRHTN